MSNSKGKTTSISGNGFPKPSSGTAPARSKRQVRKPSHILWNKYDEEAAATFDQINLGEVDVVRSSQIVPYPRYPDLKAVVSLKRQTHQEFVWALILKELDRLDEEGVYVPLAKRLSRQNGNTR